MRIIAVVNRDRIWVAETVFLLILVVCLAITGIGGKIGNECANTAEHILFQIENIIGRIGHFPDSVRKFGSIAAVAVVYLYFGKSVFVKFKENVIGSAYFFLLCFLFAF